jgi:hypothetical protein
VTLFEMQPQLGGRASRVRTPASSRSTTASTSSIGPYTETLRPDAGVGVDIEAAFVRTPLRLHDPQGPGPRLPPARRCSPSCAACSTSGGWSCGHERLRLLMAAAGWGWRRFECDPALSVAELTAHCRLRCGVIWSIRCAWLRSTRRHTRRARRCSCA